MSSSLGSSLTGNLFFFVFGSQMNGRNALSIG